MKKQLKVMAVLSTAAFVAAVTPEITVAIPGTVSQVWAAKGGWVEVDGNLRYQDGDGYDLTDSWKKKDNDWYYLDDEGNLSRSMMVDEYYVDENGKRVINTWIEVQNDDEWDEDAPDVYYYYFGKDGKAAMAKWQVIEGKYYYFDDEGHMKTGKMELDGDTYYLGKETDGVMKTGWVQLTNEAEDPEEDTVWHFFDNAGKMVMNQVDRKINGNYYSFEDGVLQTGWYLLPAAEKADNAAAEDAEAAETTAVKAPTIASYQYYEADGKRANGWYHIEGAPDISEEAEIFTFYFKNGQAYHAETGKGVQTFTIDGKKYGFNENGEMVTDLQVVTMDDNTKANFYFGTDGIMKTGKQNIYDEDLDETQTWLFVTDGGDKGKGFHGIRENNVYNNGLRMDASRDLRYAPVELDGTKYLVNTSGAIQKASSSSKSAAKADLGNGFKDYKDANDKVWTVDANGVVQ